MKFLVAVLIVIGCFMVGTTLFLFLVSMYAMWLLIYAIMGINAIMIGSVTVGILFLCGLRLLWPPSES